MKFVYIIVFAIIDFFSAYVVLLIELHLLIVGIVYKCYCFINPIINYSKEGKRIGYAE